MKIESWSYALLFFISITVQAQQTSAQITKQTEQERLKPILSATPKNKQVLIDHESNVGKNTVDDKKSKQNNDNSNDDWANVIHQSITNSVYQSAFWFDSFFTLDDNEQQKAPKTSAKIRLGWLPKRTDLSPFETRFRIKLSLPNLRNRLDIILSDDSEDDLADLPLETFNSTQNFSQDSFSAALRFVNKREKDRFTDTRIGISSNDLFVRFRHKRRFSWADTHGVKVDPSVYYFVGDGLGARLLLEYNYQQNDSHQYRFNYSVRASQSFRGQKWKYGLYSLKQLGDRRARVFGLVAQGRLNSATGSFTEKYDLSYRYRFNAFKKWLFFEVEPFLEWAKEDGFDTNPGIALRIEGYFERH
ncbi:MAG: hypothetical protein COB35_11845 [Gammaproteobacteria bacterium]|nr:MAG: hypothetical protein COB35_11845 [Gammaproteobacteria bacterium]